MPIYKMNGTKDGLRKYRVRINYVDTLGKARQIDRVCYGLDEAKQLEYKLNYELQNKAITPRMTLQSLYDEYIAAKKHAVRETSLSKTSNRLKNHVLNTLGSVRIDALTPANLGKWKNTINEFRTSKKTPLSVTTKNGIYREFKALLNYAVNMEYIPKNPLIPLGGFNDAYEGKKEMDFYTADEFLKFISAARSEAERRAEVSEWYFYVFFNIAFYTGMRKGEINALNWNDIKDNAIHITKSVAQKLKGDDRITPPKNKSSNRIIQIPAPLKAVLDEHYERCKRIDGFSDDMFICGGKKSIRDSTLCKRAESYAKLAGVKIIRIHDFRHSHASLLANEGINIQEIARRLGHSNVEVTWNIYSHLYPREEERALEILNKIIDNKQ